MHHCCTEDRRSLCVVCWLLLTDVFMWGFLLSNACLTWKIFNVFLCYYNWFNMLCVAMLYNCCCCLLYCQSLHTLGCYKRLRKLTDGRFHKWNACHFFPGMRHCLSLPPLPLVMLFRSLESTALTHPCKSLLK